MSRTLWERIEAAGWALVAASALGLATPAFAQRLGRPAGKEPAPVDLAGFKEEMNSPLDPVQARAEIAMIELAWLSHPATFPLSLTAQVEGKGLTLHGFVPNAGVRQQ